MEKQQAVGEVRELMFGTGTARRYLLRVDRAITCTVEAIVCFSEATGIKVGEGCDKIQAQSSPYPGYFTIDVTPAPPRGNHG